MEITRGKIKKAQKVVIYGPEGIGKSTFASMFPNPVFIDTEGSTSHLDVARTPRPSSFTMLLEQVKYFREHPKECDTLVIDTADWAEQLCVDEVCSKAKKTGIEDFGYGKGYVYLMEEFGRLLNLLEDLIDIGINTVFTAHAQMRKFEQPDEQGSYDRWELKLQKKTAPLLKEWADMVLFANYRTIVVKTDDQKNKAQGGKRVMYTAHHPCWDAKNRHGLPEMLEFSFEQIRACIPDRKEIGKTIQEVDELKVLEKQSSTALVEKQTKPEVKQQPKKEPPVEHQKSTTSVPKNLYDLMIQNNVTGQEIQQAVACRGYYPEDTPIENYDPQFVAGVLVGAWPAVFAMIADNRKKNNVENDIFEPVTDEEEIPFQKNRRKENE